MDNPLLLYKNDTNDSFIRFDLIKDEHFEPAFQAALKTAKENLEKVITNPHSPTFQNTVEALEYTSEDLDRVSSIFFNLKESHTNKLLDQLAQKISPILSDFSNDVIFNEDLFKRVKFVYDSKPVLETKEQQRLLEKTYKNFIRNGALLSSADKELVRECDKKLSVLTQQFSENLLGATNAYTLLIIDPSDLSGLPVRVRDMAAKEAKEKDKQGWLFTLKAPSIGSFMQFADRANLRKELSLAGGSIGMQEPYDSKNIVLEIVRLRKKIASILGYPSHAHFVLDNRMAKNPENVREFFSTLYDVARPLAEKDFERVRSYKENLTGERELYPWDVAYYSEKIKKEEYSFDEELLRPYLKMEQVIEGVFKHAELLYGLSFKERTDIPVYHTDVTVFEVNNNEEFMGLLYLDLFPRDSKREGAWADMVKGQYVKNGIDHRPSVTVVGNLTRPTDKQPSLLTSDETLTIFHEFGHALHILLSKCQYASLSTYNTAWDFVELPSQLMQSWLLRSESFELFARHYQTQEVLPKELLEASLNADRFMNAWGMLSQISSAVLDMTWHSEIADQIKNVEEFEREVKKPYRLYSHTWDGVSQSTSFHHIFAAGAGYSAGYYSYHWAEVLAADAFEYFKEKGLFSKEIAQKFKENVLSKGDTEEPLELYRRFRGRDADPTALFRHKGLL